MELMKYVDETKYVTDPENFNSNFGYTHLPDESFGNRLKYLNDAVFSNSELIDGDILVKKSDFRLSPIHACFFEGFLININKTLIRNP